MAANSNNFETRELGIYRPNLPYLMTYEFPLRNLPPESAFVVSLNTTDYIRRQFERDPRYAAFITVDTPGITGEHFFQFYMNGLQGFPGYTMRPAPNSSFEMINQTDENGKFQDLVKLGFTPQERTYVDLGTNLDNKKVRARFRDIRRQSSLFIIRYL